MQFAGLLLVNVHLGGHAGLLHCLTYGYVGIALTDRLRDLGQALFQSAGLRLMNFYFSRNVITRGPEGSHELAVVEHSRVARLVTGEGLSARRPPPVT